MKLSPILILALLFSCSPDEDHAHPYSRHSERPEIKAFREKITSTIQEAKSLQLRDRAYIPDGGSILFFLKSDDGTEFEIQALHHDETMGGSVKFQVFLIHSYQAKAEFELRPGSPLEDRILSLLEHCSLSDGSDYKSDWPRLTPETRRWLVDRIKNRSLPWKPCN